MPGEKRGNIPSIDYYNKMYGKKGWHSSTIISLGIGQGEILVTPLQLCNFYATIANRGFYFTPHIVKKIMDPESDKEVNHKIEKHYSKVGFATFRRTVDGLENVVVAGTAKGSRIDSIAVCGKTGTVQNPHGKDHSVFCGFAPKDKPKIAIAVVVENCGFGATYAAPIASLIMEKFLKDSIPSKRLETERKMMEMDLIHPGNHPVKNETRDTTYGQD